MGDGVPQSHGIQPVSTNTEYSSLRMHSTVIYYERLLMVTYVITSEGGRFYLAAGASQILSTIHITIHHATANPKS